MKRMNKILSHSTVRLVLVVLIAVALPFSGTDPQAAPPKASVKRYVTIDFNDVDINLFIKYISELTKKNFIVDRAVKGNVTIISPSKISEEDAYRVFESVLEVHGFTTVPAGSVIKIVPAVQARSKSIPTIRRGDVFYPEDKVVTQIIPLVHTNADALKKILAPLVSKTSVMISHADSGILILTDVQSNISRLMEIIEAVDVPSIGEETVILPLEHASATNIAKSVTQLFLQAARKGVRPAKIKVIPYERTNSLIVFAPKAEVAKIRDLIAQLDTELPKGEGNIHVYYLQHANAEELVKVLMNLPDQQTDPAKKAGKVQAPAISKDLQIVADGETNSLIITAAKDEYIVLENVIKKLDIPRRMVYMEALIMEVQVTRDFQIGVQWAGGGVTADGTGVVYSGFSGNEASPYNNLDGIAGDDPSLPAGFALGVLKTGIEIGGMHFPDLGAVLRAFKNDQDINIISTPQILTTDNKEASIKVGENVPYITSQNTTTAQQDYTNYEYKDVATTLKITPQINQSDVVRLEIGVEVIKLQALNEGRPTTFTRTADTTVVVRNQETVVIGGIIGQDTTTGEYKVPLLGDIPLVGWLFKSRDEQEERTNLFIFITPHIVENPAELANLYYKKRDVMERVQPGSSEIPDEFFYRKANPEHAVALTDLGFAKLQQDENEKARQYFEQALDVDPENPYAMINLGVVYEREGKTADAEAMYRKVLELEPGTEEGDAPGELQQEKQLLKNIARDNLKHLQGVN